MSTKVWTRESLTEQILTDVAGMWKHMDEREGEPVAKTGVELMGGVKGGCIALIEGQMADTRDLLTLAVCMLHAIREVSLEGQARERAAS